MDNDYSVNGSKLVLKLLICMCFLKKGISTNCLRPIGSMYIYLLRYTLAYDNSKKASLIDCWKKYITFWTHLNLKVCQEKHHGAPLYVFATLFFAMERL